MKLLAYLKKLSLVFIVLLLFLSFSSSSSSVFAQTDPSGCGPRLYDANCNLNRLMEQSLQNGDNGFGYVHSFLAATIASGNIILQGDNYFTSATPTESGETGYRIKNPGLLAYLGSGLSSMYSYRPISGVDYLASLNPFKPAHAAGGNLLDPVLEIWKLFRNLAYILIVLSLIGFGFLVMFRYKLDPRTVITVSDSLPRIAVALILITFSYTIVGFVIDGMKIAEGSIFNTLHQLEPTFRGKTVNASRVTGPTVPDPTRPGTSLPAYPIDFGYWEVFSNFFGSFRGISVPCVNSGRACASSLIDNAAQLVFNFMVASLAVQLIFSLLRYFAGFFVLAIFGPIVFLWSVLPGQEETGKKWFMQLLTGALVFPAVFLFLNIAYYIGIWISGANSQVVLPTGGPGMESLPRFFGGGTGTVPGGSTLQETVGGLTKIGILLITSKLPEMIEEGLKAAPSGRVAGAGVDVRGAARRVPFIGGFLG